LYTSDNIKILKELEPIRMRPGMFIGSTHDATHLLKEAIDNAMDELINGYASKIGVFINTKESIYTVVDIGRGIPLGDVDGIPAPIAIATRLFSGGKFDKNSYKISSGLHGVGLVAVNALSDFMEMDIYKEVNSVIQHGYYKFENGMLSYEKNEKFDGEKPYSTRITFKPSSKYFERISVDLESTRQRLSIGSMFTDKEIVYAIDDKKDIIKEKIDTYFLSNIAKEPLFDPIFLEHQNKNEKISMIFSYEKENQPNKIFASVNLLPVNSGSHITQIQNTFINVFDKYRKQYHFNKSDSLIGLKCYFNIFLEQTSYTSQTKDSLSVSKKILSNIINDSLVNKIDKILNDKKLIKKLAEKFDYYRLHLKSKNIKNMVSSNKNVRGITDKNSKLKDCQLFENSELIIIEGDSAGGTCIKARNPKIHAVLPLKGKILNVANKKDFSSIIKNKEIQDIIKSIGVGVKSKTTKDNINNIRYEKIILTPDADPDGKHIATLLLILFSIVMPEVINAGKLYLADMPLYGVQTKNKFYPAWTTEELTKLQEIHPNGRSLRFKGLGEYQPNQLKQSLFDKETRRLYQIKPVSSEYQNYLVKLVTSAEEKRKLFGGQ